MIDTIKKWVNEATTLPKEYKIESAIEWIQDETYEEELDLTNDETNLVSYWYIVNQINNGHTVFKKDIELLWCITDGILYDRVEIEEQSIEKILK